MQFWLARVCRDPCNTSKPQLVAFLCIRVFMASRLKMGMILHLLSLRSIKQLHNSTDLVICRARCVHTSDFYLSLKGAVFEICSNKTMWLVCFEDASAAASTAWTSRFMDSGLYGVSCCAWHEDAGSEPFGACGLQGEA